MNAKEKIFLIALAIIAVLTVFLLYIIKDKSMLFKDYSVYSFRKAKKRKQFPKIVHQTWKTKDLTETQKRWQETVLNNYSSYNYKLWTDDEIELFVSSYFPWFLPYWNNLTFRKKLDTVKYMWLYVYGGIYLDLDVVVSKSLDDILTKFTDCVFIPCCNDKMEWKENSKAVSSSILASYPENPFWIKMLEYVAETQETGDIALSNVLLKIHREQEEKPNIIILSESRLGLSFKTPVYSKRLHMKE